ncbi:MAG TPA: hypothetical protein VHM69_07675 [Rubrobacter sp.]|nr:hypothetical protein [Rubrobacter sp.]
MREDLTPEQRRSLEGLVREKGERCGLCGNSDLRCGKDAAEVGGGYSVQLRCTNGKAGVHDGGIGLIWGYTITSDEARRVGLG